MELKETACENLLEKYERWVDRAKRMHPEFEASVNAKRPWSAVQKPLKESRIALISTGGIHHVHQSPFDVANPKGDWSFREIPHNTLASDLRATHEHYDTDAANEDINVVFPIDALRELVTAGIVGASADNHFGLMGFIPSSRRIIEELGPNLVELLSRDRVDAVLLSPG